MKTLPATWNKAMVRATLLRIINMIKNKITWRGEVSKSHFRVLKQNQDTFHTARIFKQTKLTHTLFIKSQDQNVKPLSASSGNKLFSRLYFW